MNVRTPVTPSNTQSHACGATQYGQQNRYQAQRKYVSLSPLHNPHIPYYLALYPYSGEILGKISSDYAGGLAGAMPKVEKNKGRGYRKYIPVRHIV